MYLAVKKVLPTSNYQLILTFANGEVRLFDMKPYLETDIFQELKNNDLFNTVRISFDSVEWDNDADMDPEILYSDSKPLDNQIASEPTEEYELPWTKESEQQLHFSNRNNSIIERQLLFLQNISEQKQQTHNILN